MIFFSRGGGKCPVLAHPQWVPMTAIGVYIVVCKTVNYKIVLNFISHTIVFNVIGDGKQLMKKQSKRTVKTNEQRVLLRSPTSLIPMKYRRI